MSPSARERDEGLERIAEHVRDAVKAPSSTELERGLMALRARLAIERVRPRLLASRLAMVAGVLLCFGLGAALVRLGSGATRTAPVPVAVTRVAGGEILEGGYLSEVGEHGLEIHFNEGTQVVLAPGTRGRLRSVTADGARFAIERGVGSFSITPSADRRWLVEAGPFAVAVKGTDFTVDWEPGTEVLEVRLRRGRVTVSGPVVGRDLALRAGQNLTISLPKGESRIVEARPDSPALPAPSHDAPAVASADGLEQTLLVPVPSSAPLALPSANAPSRGDERGWRRALAAGQWDRIIDDVERTGVAASLRTLSSDELFLVADAARYRRRGDLARAALLAQLERFPSSARSVDAIFLLGRVEELRGDGKARAVQRYDEYLSRAPHGTYAGPALGRKMILTKETLGTDSARKIADEYLTRFPGGSYAEAARSIRQAP